MEKLIFLMKYEELAPHEVIFRREGKAVTASCSCSSAKLGMDCRHRLDLIGGRDQCLVSGNYEDTNILKEWLENTPLKRAFADFEALRKASWQISEDIQEARRVLAAELRGSAIN